MTNIKVQIPETSAKPPGEALLTDKLLSDAFPLFNVTLSVGWLAVALLEEEWSDELALEIPVVVLVIAVIRLVIAVPALVEAAVVIVGPGGSTLFIILESQSLL
jgi:hypothetical protein